jgi:hypothetical protein
VIKITIALAGLKPRLVTDAEKLPGPRVLDGRFTAVDQAIGTPKGREAGAKYLREFIEDAKASGPRRSRRTVFAVSQSHLKDQFNETPNSSFEKDA